MATAVKLVNTSGAPIPDEALVRATLAHANGAEIFMNGVRQPDPSPSRLRLVSVLERIHQAHGLGPSIEARGHVFREILEQSLRLLGRLDVRPVYEIGPGGLLLDYFRDFLTVDAAMSYAVLLMLDQRQPFGKALCRCRLSRCGQFYLAARSPNGGPANRTYCTPEHRAESHDSAQSRTARKRQRKRSPRLHK